MAYISKDEQILNKIQKYVHVLKDIHNDVKSMKDHELEYSRNGFAVTQCITNIYEIAKHLDNDEVADKLTYLNSRHISKLRNVSAHDYGSINWSIAKDVCLKIISTVTDELIEECMSIVKTEFDGVRDYTELDGGESE